MFSAFFLSNHPCWPACKWHVPWNTLNTHFKPVFRYWFDTVWPSIATILHFLCPRIRWKGLFWVCLSMMSVHSLTVTSKVWSIDRTRFVMSLVKHFHLISWRTISRHRCLQGIYVHILVFTWLNKWNMFRCWLRNSMEASAYKQQFVCYGHWSTY